MQSHDIETERADMEVITILISSLAGIITAVVGAIVAFYGLRKDKLNKEEALRKTVSDQNSAVNDALKALLRDRIVTSHPILMEKEFVDIYERENLNELYDSYKTLGGNHVVDVLYEELKVLPTLPPISIGKDTKKEQ